ncbi:NAD(P)-dependent oxidoreductase [Methylomonas sp. SURF-2]|uniref:NAD(P)-dependent oxidoreductase n=1 Tax=Methylomonas subterranea TaxID=2952225 RepID=A0ABT1TCA5_9GAMM|nr:NAD(P)-dependent oxidoreductase [Methylomonas sp. SURF-2]
MIVAVTGGTGFIGRHLIKFHLDVGDEVRYLTRSTALPLDMRARPICGALSDKEILDKLVDGVDVLYHCAAELHDATKIHETNVIGTKNLLDAAAGKISRWVQLSSTGVYGSKPLHDVNENTPINPGNAYECSKAEADELVFEYASNGHFEAVILRPSNVYGIDMPNQSLFQLIKMVKKGLFFFIGKGNATVNYIHVNNVVHALALCATKPLPGKGCNIYIISDFMRLEDFISVIASAVSVPRPRFHFPEPLIRLIASFGRYFPKFPLRPSRVDALTYIHHYETQKIQSELGYQHQVSMEEGIQELARHAK